LIVSGMASSSIGMTELKYKRLPFETSGRDLELLRMKHGNNIHRDIIIISGVRSDNDVMRGEETQLIGCEHHAGDERLFIFPGTHSKHVWVKNGEAVGFKTYMTGEFFQLLSEKSILSSAVQQGEFNHEKSRQGFVDGLNESKRSNLLHGAFHARTNIIFSEVEKEENFYFLSGLVIGTELSVLASNKQSKITLVASGLMKELYEYAIIELAIDDDLKVEDADMALVNGHFRILEGQGLL